MGRLTERYLRYETNSGEKFETIRKCAPPCDEAYETVKPTIKPGMTEAAGCAELEYAFKKNGGEYNFTLISSGDSVLTTTGCPCYMRHMFDKVIEQETAWGDEIKPAAV